MTKATLLLFAVAAVLAVQASATRVNECKSGKPLPDTTRVVVTNCDAPPCKLKKRTKVGIIQKFTPNRDIPKLTTNVFANILGMSLPFIGVDGTDACSKIFNADNVPTSCPLKQGVEYIYKNEFPILQIYPTVDLVVHWALKEGDQDVTCFEVPARIQP
ncbi:ecdysteroid-regulated 16 kDa protein-like [Phymastichus coffea]|uniref:ecdysteroid-regulated 16 kDa protein-like n=1 Tax=Phymastichus coffea TaxID=108790 RepID=UPI00273C5025|nr:ecdysteroid-regulated 16 kDa protein-like [Phymastichus coffea]